jgi:hypothetical protein
MISTIAGAPKKHPSPSPEATPYDSGASRPSPTYQPTPNADAMFVGVLMLWVIGFIIYIVPSGIAMLRNHPNAIPIILINLLLGWVCGIGWVIALIWSFSAIDANRSYR